MKKILSLILAVVMIMVMSIPAYAAVAGCSHEYSETITPVWRFDDEENHRKVFVTTYLCGKCAYSYQIEEPTSTVDDHTSTYVSASCNGTTQTHVKYCSTCYTTYSVPFTCPRAPHTGNCNWLPI